MNPAHIVSNTIRILFSSFRIVLIQSIYCCCLKMLGDRHLFAHFSDFPSVSL